MDSVRSHADGAIGTIYVAGAAFPGFLAKLVGYQDPALKGRRAFVASRYGVLESFRIIPRPPVATPDKPGLGESCECTPLGNAYGDNSDCSLRLQHE